MKEYNKDFACIWQAQLKLETIIVFVHSDAMVLYTDICKYNLQQQMESRLAIYHVKQHRSKWFFVFFTSQIDEKIELMQTAITLGHTLNKMSVVSIFLVLMLFCTCIPFFSCTELYRHDCQFCKLPDDCLTAFLNEKFLYRSPAEVLF